MASNAPPHGIRSITFETNSAASTKPFYRRGAQADPKATRGDFGRSSGSRSNLNAARRRLAAVRLPAIARRGLC